MTARRTRLVILGVIGAAWVGVVMGLARPPRRTPLATFAGAAASNWELSGFAVNAVYPPPQPDASPGPRLFGSLIGADGSTGTLRSPWLDADGDFALLVAGHPTMPGNSLQVEVRSAGSVSTIPVLVDPGARWVMWQPPDPVQRGRVQLRITARDGSTALHGWMGVSEPVTPGRQGADALDALLRVLGTGALAIVLLLGPGIALRALTGKPRSLALLIAPGLLVLVGTGACCWALASRVGAQVVAAAVLLPVLAACTAIAATRDPRLSSEEARALALYALVIAIAVAKATWSHGPDRELYGGTISRTLEPGERSDARVPYCVVQLVAHGVGPHSPLADAYFAPWSFSSRGPIAGLAAAPVVLLTGARVPAGLPDMLWQPFDAEGFAAYRIALIALGATSILAVFALASHLGGPRAAVMACALAAGAPFVVHETYFTWPKLASGAAALVAFHLVLGGRPGRGGLAIAVSYLLHPGGLLAAPTAALLWFFPPGLPHAGTTWTRRIREPQFWSGALRLGCGIVAGPLAWRLVNIGHFTQSGFLSYLLMNGTERALGVSDWLRGRAVSLATTFVPLAGYAHYVHTGEFASHVTAFFHQYWCTAPFAFGIAAASWLVRELWVTRRSSPRTFWTLVAAPLAVFTIYWGASLGGMMREGLHAWALSLIVVVACSHAARESTSGWEGLLLGARGAEVLAMLVVPSLVPATRLVRPDVLWTDVASVAVMVLGCVHVARAALQAARGARPAEAVRPARGTLRARSTLDA